MNLTDLVDEAARKQRLYELGRAQYRMDNDLPNKKLGKRWRPEPRLLDPPDVEPEG